MKLKAGLDGGDKKQMTITYTGLRDYHKYTISAALYQQWYQPKSYEVCLNEKIEMIAAKHLENFQEKDDCWEETRMCMCTYPQTWNKILQNGNKRHQLNNNYLLQ